MLAPISASATDPSAAKPHLGRPENKSWNKIQSNKSGGLFVEGIKWTLCRVWGHLRWILAPWSMDSAEILAFGRLWRSGWPWPLTMKQACPDTAWFPARLFITSFLSANRPPRVSWHWKDSLKHEHTHTHPPQHGPRGNKGFRRRNYTNKTEIPGYLLSIKQERGTMATGPSENKDRLLEIKTVTDRITIQ